MHKKLITTLAVGVVLSTAAFAQNTIVDFGESTTYVTGNENLAAGGNGAYITSNISPASGYTGPTFTGGVLLSTGDGASTWQIANDYATTGSNDAIRFRTANVAGGVSATFVGMFAGSQTFSIDNTANSSFFLNGRRDGGQTGAGITGVRWLLQDTGGRYYVSALNETAAAQFSGSYSGTSGVTGSSLVGLDWFNYTFGDASIGSAIADEVAFFGSTQFSAAGFNYTAARVSSPNAIDMSFADFSVVAIPEPSSFAALGGLAVLGLAASRRRRQLA